MGCSNSRVVAVEDSNNVKRASFVDRFKQSSFDLRARFGTPKRTMRRMTQRSPKVTTVSTGKRTMLPSQAQSDAMASATVHPGAIDHRSG